MAEIVPRSIRPASPPLGLYLRPSRNDHTIISQLLSEERLPASGLVLDPTLWSRQKELAEASRRLGNETILDLHTVELSTEGGFVRSGIADLPWAGTEPHQPGSLRGAQARAFVATVAEYAATHATSALLAPTHYVATRDSEWIGVDAALTEGLRRALDERGLTQVLIYYPLVVHTHVLRDEPARERLKALLLSLPIDAVWLRVHPFGTTSSGPLALRWYVDAARSLHSLGLPIVAERSGTVGVALMAFGAVGGIESGITLGERFDVGGLIRRPRTGGTPFLPSARVYIRELGGFLSRDQARAFFDHRGTRGQFGCQESACCPNGVEDMIRDPKRHFVVRRGAEVRTLSAAPARLRAGIYLEEFLRPASDLAVRAAKLEPALAPVRKRLDSWRGTLGSMHQTDADREVSIAMAPEGRRIVRRRGA